MFVVVQPLFPTEEIGKLVLLVLVVVILAAGFFIFLNWMVWMVGALQSPAKRRRLAVIGACVVLLSGLVVWRYYRSPSAVLFAGLVPAEAAMICDELNNQKIPHKLSDSGHAVFVPKALVYDVRLMFASTNGPVSLDEVRRTKKFVGPDGPANGAELRAFEQQAKADLVVGVWHWESLRITKPAKHEGEQTKKEFRGGPHCPARTSET